MSRPLNVFLTAGEASGDTLGSRLMRALKAQYAGEIHFTGVGGEQMQAEGLRSLFPMEELSLMGITEIAPKLMQVLKRISQTSDYIVKNSPDIVVTIDSPDFSFRVAKSVHASKMRGPLWVHYVAPTVWAWRPERAAKVAGLYDGVMCLYPMEPSYFTRHGMSAAFTGHPVLEGAYKAAKGRSFRDMKNIPADAKTLGVLLGSRNGELKRVAPHIRAALEQMRGDLNDVHIIAPTLKHIEPRVRNILSGLPCPVHVTVDPAHKWDAFAAMDTAVAVSGTVALELAVAGVPHVIAYRMSPVTWEIVKRKINVRYAHMANILLDRDIVPEYIQQDCNADNIADGIRRVLSESENQKTAFNELRSMLSGADDGAPSEQAARYLLDLYSRSSIGR